MGSQKSRKNQGVRPEVFLKKENGVGKKVGLNWGNAYYFNNCNLKCAKLIDLHFNLLKKLDSPIELNLNRSTKTS